ncbi:hypothetical protein DET64_11933 [Marinobacter nauticus]|uniref:Uncharacterized protein n=1 Tax=Marinobacter nauticus TaxID=2743 RepID=A0A368UMD0_MARNT|nr:hypothetical protein DET64_11933 [Marinobacter nauticus]RCW29909.1 hypothetical protein DET51_11933 [Marinobacter nauticus]
MNKVVAEEKARFVVKMVSRGTVSKDRFEKKTQVLRPNLNARFATWAAKTGLLNHT